MLSDRYITGRQLPDKAIDLVDESASRLRMEIESSPVEIDQLRRAVDRMKMEQLALERETDEASTRPAGAAARRPRRPGGAAARARGAVGAGEGRASRAPASCASRSTRCASRPSGSSATATWRGPSEILYGRIPELEKQIAAAERRDADHRGPDGQARRSAPRRSPRSSRPGPASPPAGCSRARPRSCCSMEEIIGERLIGQRAAVKRGLRRRTALAGRASPTRTGRPARSCSSARPASARPSWPSRWRTSCSTTSGRSSGST